MRCRLIHKKNCVLKNDFKNVLNQSCDSEMLLKIQLLYFSCIQNLITFLNTIVKIISIHNSFCESCQGCASLALFEDPNLFHQPLHIHTEHKYKRESGIHWCNNNKLWPNSTKPRVALASFPGSGNTWLRYLLQQSTGILTGSVFADPSLQESGFGEGITNQSVLVIKTHNVGITHHTNNPFDRAILLVRDPFDAILAEFNRLQVITEDGRMSHTGHATLDKFHGNWTLEAKKIFPSCNSFDCFAQKMILRWKEFNLSCLNKFQSNLDGLIIISYEDLVGNPEKELSRVLQFLNVSISDSSMKCAMDRKEGVHHRKKDKADHIQMYSPKVTRRMKSEKAFVYNALGLPYPQSVNDNMKELKDI